MINNMEGCIVGEWLRSLGLIHYTQAFLDNGYDDLEVCKQIGCLDLDAIGVVDPLERAEVLAAVKELLEEGGTRVYFTLDPDYHSPNGLLPASSPPESAAGAGELTGGTIMGRHDPMMKNCVNLGVASPQAPLINDPNGFKNGGASNNCNSIEDYDEAEEYEIKPTGTMGGMRAPPPPGGPPGGGIEGSKKSGDAYDIGRAALVTFPRIQLAAIVRDRAEEDGIDLAQLYQPVQQVEPGGPLDELAKRYCSELKTHYHHVLEALRFQAEMAATMFQDQDLYSTEPDEVGFSMFSVAGHSHRSVPPPLPSCPPPSTSFADGSALEGTRLSPHHSNRSPVHHSDYSNNVHANEELTELADGDASLTLKKRTGLGRFFKNMGGRRSGRKYVYKQHEGDLHASQITMPDDERIELMLLVKEGKLSMHDAVETVKHYENWKQRQLAMEQAAMGGQESPLLDVTPSERLRNHHHHAKVKKVTFSLPLLKLPTLRRKSGGSGGGGVLTKQKSLSSADSPLKGRRYASDYCEPPVEISPEDEAYPGGTPAFRSDTMHAATMSTRPTRHHRKAPDISDPGHVSTYSPSQWISPMLLRRYIKNDGGGVSGGGGRGAAGDAAGGSGGAGAVREQRRGLFSSPFIKRKGSLDSKVAAASVTRSSLSGSVGIMGSMAAAGSLRTSGSFGASSSSSGSSGEVADGGGRGNKGYRGIHHSSSLAFGSRESLREQQQHNIRGSRSAALASFGSGETSRSAAPVSGQQSGSRETITVATVHATDCLEDVPMDVGMTPSSLRHGSGDVDDDAGCNNGRSAPRRSGYGTGPTINESNRNINGHHHPSNHHHSPHHTTNNRDHQQSTQQMNRQRSSPNPNSTTCDITTSSTTTSTTTTSTTTSTTNHHTSFRIETCMVCNKNEENLKTELSAADQARDSPDIGIEDTSPTGTLDSTASEDFKDSKYGSSSTMSVGSDVSPVTERRSGKKAAGKPSKLSQHHTNSAGEECMSSDYDEQDEMSLKTTTRRSSALVKDVVCTCNHKGETGLTPSGSPHHLPSSPSTMSEMSHDTDSIIYSPRRHKNNRKSSKRPRPKTVEELLGRLGIQHLLNVFLLHGYQSLELFSELEEEDLDELSITQPEDRAKILTAAQLLLDYEGASHDQSAFLHDTHSIASSQSQSGISSCDSQHDSLLANVLAAATNKTVAPSSGGGVHSGSSSDELNLQHATISDQESSCEPDEGTLKAAVVPTTDGDAAPQSEKAAISINKDRQYRQNASERHPSRISATSDTNSRDSKNASDSENNLMIANKNKANHTSHSRSKGQDNGVRTPAGGNISNSDAHQRQQSVLPVPDISKVKLRMSTGTCTSPNLGRRSLTDSNESCDTGSSCHSKKSQSSDSAVSSDMDSSSTSSPLRRRSETSDDTSSMSPSRTGGGAANNKAQRASTGSGQLAKPPKPQVPVRTVSLPLAPTSSSSTGSGAGAILSSFRSVQEVAAAPPAAKGTDGAASGGAGKINGGSSNAIGGGGTPAGTSDSGGSKQSPVTTTRLGKISSVRDKV